MAFTENLFIYKDTLVLCKILLKYSKTVSKIVRYSTYNIRRKAWAMMPYKDRVFCVNMKKIRIMNKYKT